MQTQSSRRKLSANTNIGQAVDHALKWRWVGKRSEARSTGQLRIAIDTLCEVLGRDSRAFTAADVTFEDVQACVNRWLHRDRLANASVNLRLCMLSAVGIDCTGCWRSKDIGLKWWLRPDQAADLIAWLSATPPPFPRAHLMADYIEWATHVGTRVEETLRLTRGEIALSLKVNKATGEVENNSEITVPGTKTGDAQATIAIALAPALLLQRRLESIGPEPAARVFPIKYVDLKNDWDRCRTFLGVTHNKLSTLKAIRRTAARNLTTNGMPLPVLQGILRHSSSRTTEGYLRLVGGYTPKEQRKWL